MPTVLRVGPYEFYFYSHENSEPPHIHVDRENMSAKFWLENSTLAMNIGFSPKELRKIQAIVTRHREELLEAWNGHFGNFGR